jgi:hypothetical protein
MLPTCVTDNFKKNVAMPHPSDILGPLMKEEESWPVAYCPEDDEGGKYLRQTQAHADLLFHLTKVVVMYDTFKHQSKTELVSKYLSAGLEAFLVVAYLNGYDKWLLECISEGPVSTNTEEGSADLSSVTHSASTGNSGTRDHTARTVSSVVTPHSTGQPRFTAAAMGAGKHKGWSDEGIILYQKVAVLLGEQRKDRNLLGFERDLMERFRGPTGSRRPTGRIIPQFDEIGEYYTSRRNTEEETTTPYAV